MKALFGFAALLIVLGVVGIQMKSQTQAVAADSSNGKNVEAKVKQQLETALQTARPSPDDKPAADGK